MNEGSIKSQKKSMIGTLLVLAAGMMWGCMGVLVHSLNDIGLDSMEIAVLRTGISFVLLVVSLLIINRKCLWIRCKDLWCFVGSGVVSLSVFCVAYFQAIATTSMSMAAVLLYTAPIWVIIFSAVLFQEKITKQKVLALILAFIGCVFVTGLVGEQTSVNIPGVCFGLIAGIGYALYSIFSRYAMNRGYGAMTITVYTFLFATIGVLPFVTKTHITSVVMTMGAWQLVKMIFLIFWVTIAPYLCYTAGLATMEGGRASVIASVEPVMATILGILIYKERLYWYSLVGIILVMSAIVLVNKKS